MTALLKAVQEAGEDCEWYPTTDEIIQAVIKDMGGDLTEDIADMDDLEIARISDIRRPVRILDVGAGDGRVLERLREAAYAGHGRLTNPDDAVMLAIEQSTTLIRSWDSRIRLAGTNFHEQTLFEIPADIAFCNPPYSEFGQWMIRLIRELNYCYLYLVVPERWKHSDAIKMAIDVRGAEVTVLGSYDFADGERKARAKVDLLRVERGRHSSDAFDIYFTDHLGDLEQKLDDAVALDEQVSEEAEYRAAALAQRKDLVGLLVEIYQEQLLALSNLYRALLTVPPELLRGLSVGSDEVKTSLRQKLSGLKAGAWGKLFDEMHPVISRLTAKNRRALRDDLNAYGGIDFTVSNIHALVLRTIDGANAMMDEQFLDVYEKMITLANVRLYKSNARVFDDQRWRYSADRDELGLRDYHLDYRIVLDRVGGVAEGWRGANGLSTSAMDYLQDLLVVATNLGWTVPEDNWPAKMPKWEAGEAQNIVQADGTIVLKVRAFKNGNLHIWFDQHLILAMNVTFGRLKGWLKDGAQAAEELDDPRAAALFEHVPYLTAGSMLALEAPPQENT